MAEAVAMTCQTAGKSIFFSGIAVLIGLLGMLFVDLPPSYESRFGADLLKTAYDPRMMGPIQIVIHTKDEVWESASIREIRAYGEQVKGVSGVKEVQSYLSSLGSHSDAELAGMLKNSDVKAQIEDAISERPYGSCWLLCLRKIPTILRRIHLSESFAA